jgi:hypothetical protein
MYAAILLGRFFDPEDVIRSSETSVHIRTTRRHIPEDVNIHNDRYDNLKAYNCVMYALQCRRYVIYNK